MNNKQSTGTGAKQDAYLRIRAAKVSQLLDLVGELGLAAAEVIHHPKLEELEFEGFESAVHRLENLLRDLQDLTSSLRMVPVGTVFKRMQRLVRDLSHQTNKPLDLILEGVDTQIDKNLVDQLYDPLMHLIRNAVDHGIESADERVAAGKSKKSRIVLAAAQQGREIHITVADDGRGLNRGAILERAREIGLVGADEEPDDNTVWSYIFHSGLSTAQEVSSLSGRGVGMDVVNAAIRSLRGRIVVESFTGLGTVLSLCIPLTLAFLDSMVVGLQDRLYAIPIDVISEVIKPSAEQVTHTSANDTELVRVRDELTPVCRLERFYNDVCPERPLVEQILVVVQTSNGMLGVPVDEIIGQQQVTMKPLRGQIQGVRAGASYALLGSGEVAITLDCERLGQEFIR
ncbi:MAG: chemotaxis protein CheA [Chloroflexi bacterium]|nr:chemotaxis protein CheA [Chloroflexota bacterium]